MNKQDSPALELEKQTLTAWAQILYRNGMIDSARLGRIITLIGKMTESGTAEQAAEAISFVCSCFVRGSFSCGGNAVRRCVFDHRSGVV